VSPLSSDSYYSFRAFTIGLSTLST
jgi:hypothetical protein